jgi:phage/plasmid-like protein (TIGR03299 family)
MPFVNYQKRPLIFNEMGKPINDLSVEEAIKEAGLDYKVGIKETRVRLADVNDPDKFLLYKVPNSFATYREDNNHVFGAVGSKYEVVQNSVALDFINQVCDYDKTVRIETAGVYKDGANMLVTAKFPEAMTIGNNDLIDKYLLFTNSHDGSGLITCAVTNIRVVCNNMLNQAIKNADSVFGFKHTKNVHNAIMSAVEKIRSAHIYHEALQESMQALKNVSVSGRDVNKFVYDLFLTAEQQDHMKLRTSIYSADKEVISTKTQNKVIAVLDTIEKGVGQEMHRGSMLWLYNGVNCYMNNVVDYKSSEDRFEALTKRTACKVNQRAFDLALTSLRAA